MFCPRCRSEFREGFTQCSDCEVDLVATLPPLPEAHPNPPGLVTVFETGNPALLAIAHSLLDEERIPYLTQGEGLQDLFGLGRLGTGFSIIAGLVHIQVEPQRADEARSLLANLVDQVGHDSEDLGRIEDEEDEEAKESPQPPGL